MRKLLMLTLLIAIPLMASADRRKVKQAEKDTEAFRYEIEAVNIAAQGTVVVKVSSNSKKPHVAQNQAMKNAVHGVIFKGYNGKGTIPGKRPLVNNSFEHEQFFDKFFKDGGDWARFVTLTNRGSVNEGDVVRLSRKEYRVSTTVTVSYANLRKYLEDNGVIGKLSDGF